MSQDMVNHPSHYNQFKREVIDEMRLIFGDEETKNNPMESKFREAGIT